MRKRFTLSIIVLLGLFASLGTTAFAQTTLKSSSFQLRTMSEFNRSSEAAIDPRSDIKIFPNPATEYLYIELTDSSLRNVNFELNNIIGNVFSLKAERVSDTHYKIYVKDLRSGYYFLTIKDQDSSYKRTYRFVKK